jgi:hypothetical protein
MKFVSITVAGTVIIRPVTDVRRCTARGGYVTLVFTDGVGYGIAGDEGAAVLAQLEASERQLDTFRRSCSA